MKNAAHITTRAMRSLAPDADLDASSGRRRAGGAAVLVSSWLGGVIR